MNLKEVKTATLWKLLTDISCLEVMQEQPHNDYFIAWYQISKGILSEIDKRMEQDFNV